MRTEALFINGVYQSVLVEILAIQDALPNHIMYLQPHSSRSIVHLRSNPPSPEDPVCLYLSVGADRPTVRYEAEIVGWDDKAKLGEERARALNRVIWTLQPEETGLYNASRVSGKVSVNLLHVWRMRRLEQPFGVELLTKTVDNSPVSPGRTTSGGWAYVHRLVANDLGGS